MNTVWSRLLRLSKTLQEIDFVYNHIKMHQEMRDTDITNSFPKQFLWFLIKILSDSKKIIK